MGGCNMRTHGARSHAESALQERRQQRRFPMRLAMRYRLTSGETGHGEIENFSSGGLLCHGEFLIPVGARAEVSVEWPVRLNGDCSLKLWLSVRVLRSGKSGTALRI